MSQDVIDEVLDRGKVRSRYSDIYFIDYESKGIQISYKKKEKTAYTIYFYNKDKDYTHFETFDLKTLEGVNWISSREDILEAYGKPKNDYIFEDGCRIVYDKFDFRIINGTLRRIGLMSK
ncbi:hypothetical protein [Tenacibaculum finnmarkense]|nr:hypothetical protein [Tenacibaculum finnmarkense]MCG8208470.1 hypothetical protein [Tenacibaculum finnmarkense genomovar finnmarkense]MCG8742737.1 hypothetical protein [Tenacibaculum finnmarkense]MCG8766146.1 hypothetical protein [Tenacibaculum finnmarkense]MCG8779108.1 hypothetical protein [Tenacibaculum finnmarkense]MCM8907635.1 hypothetical protein [Tenacibaculum finnmarkense genomovar finnmarkense]